MDKKKESLTLDERRKLAYKYLKDDKEMIEIIENYKLYLEAGKRIKNAKKDDFISSDDVLLKLGISKDELNNIEVNID